VPGVGGVGRHVDGRLNRLEAGGRPDRANLNHQQARGPRHGDASTPAEHHCREDEGYNRPLQVASGFLIGMGFSGAWSRCHAGCHRSGWGTAANQAAGAMSIWQPMRAQYARPSPDTGEDARGPREAPFPWRRRCPPHMTVTVTAGAQPPALHACSLKSTPFRRLAALSPLSTVNRVWLLSSFGAPWPSATGWFPSWLKAVR
jgi:hypothetical protein